MRLAAAALIPLAGAAVPAGEPRPNLLLICIDTLRADRLGCSGYDRPTSPHIDALAERGHRFRRAYATAPWTLPSVASMMSGLLPDTHLAHHFLAPVSEEAELLGAILQGAGYHTQSFVGNYFLQPVFGLDEGYDDYDRGCLVDRAGVNSDCISDAALQWLDAQPDTPFFLYLHYFDPHYNYVEHPGFHFGSEDTQRVKSGMDIWDLREHLPHMDAVDRQRLSDLYDSEVAFTDHHIGRILDRLRADGLLSQTLVVLCADHGEELGEHGWIGHTLPLYEETARIPLLFAGPGVLPGVSDVVVQLDDLLPTILHSLGVPLPPLGTQGRNLLPVLRGEGPPLGLDADARVHRILRDGEALLAVETKAVPLASTSADVTRKVRMSKDNWRIKVDVDENGVESYRIFKTDEPDGTNKERDPAAHPEALRMLLDAIEEEYQSRLQPRLEAEARRAAAVVQRRALVQWPWKLIVHGGKSEVELYDLDTDPAERHNLASEEAERVQRMRIRVDELTQQARAMALAAPPPLSTDIAQETREHLEALGYTR